MQSKILNIYPGLKLIIIKVEWLCKSGFYESFDNRIDIILYIKKLDKSEIIFKLNEIQYISRSIYM